MRPGGPLVNAEDAILAYLTCTASTESSKVIAPGGNCVDWTIHIWLLTWRSRNVCPLNFTNSLRFRSCSLCSFDCDSMLQHPKVDLAGFAGCFENFEYILICKGCSGAVFETQQI